MRLSSKRTDDSCETALDADLSLLEMIRDLNCYSLVRGFTPRSREVGMGGL
jgi:hypothetical protein